MVPGSGEPHFRTTNVTFGWDSVLLARCLWGTMFENFETRDIDTSGARIHFRHGGDGPPLLLLHGNPMTHVSWHKIANRLAERFHVVTPDLRGYGDSSAPDPVAGDLNYSFSAMARDQVEVMESLGYREFLVAGHDRGGRTAHRMGLDHPNRVQRLCVVIYCPAIISGPMRMQVGLGIPGTGCS